MDTFDNIIDWYVKHRDYIGFMKDCVFVVGLIATFYGYFKFVMFLRQRKALNKRQEMENDARLHGEIHEKLKEYVDSYAASQNDMRDIGVRLLYIKNYPYELDNDGFSQMLYYYFMSEGHKATGYISGKGLYVMDYLAIFDNSIYYNSKNEKWFISSSGRSFRGYKELEHKQLVKRIPFANIYGYDFNSDWADKGEPVLYTKYKYDKWKLFADDLAAVDIKQEHHLAHKITLRKKKRARKARTLLRRLRNRTHGYFMRKKTNKQLKQLRQNRTKVK